MNTKTLTFGIIASLVAVLPIAAAEDEPVVANAAATFGIHVEPASALVRPGGSASFAIILRSAQTDVTYELSVARHAGEGYRAILSNGTIAPTAGEPARAKLVVSAASQNASDHAAFQIVARDPATNESHAAIVKVALAKRDPAHQPVHFGLQLSPDAQRARPGDTATYRVTVKARDAMTLELGVGARLPDGFVATLDDERITLVQGPCERSAEANCSYYVGSTALRVQVPNETRVEGIGLEVHAANEAGERHAAHAKLAIVQRDEAGSDDLRARIHELEARIRGLEERERELREQLRMKERFIERMLEERPVGDAPEGGYALVDGPDGTVTLSERPDPSAGGRFLNVMLRPNAYGDWRAHVTDGEGHRLGGSARLFLLMEVGAGPGPGGW